MAKGRTTKRKTGTARDYPRTARLNRLVREIVAEELERLDDDRLELLTVISVDVDADMRHATVYYDNLEGEEGDALTLEALSANRRHLQAAIARQARTKNTPELAFKPDPAIRTAARIDAILRDVEPGAGTGTGDEGGAEAVATTASGEPADSVATGADDRAPGAP